MWIAISGGLSTLSLVIVAAFNRAQRLVHNLANARHQIEVQLMRRHELIPNLGSLVQGAMEQERAVIDEIVQAAFRR